MALHKVTQESIKFNKEKFGNIFANKRHLEARLQGIQRTLENVDSVSLYYLQQDLLREYEGILFQEESLWFQKSHEKWIWLGSRNTKFFHAQIVVRRKRNKIHGLQLPSGEWCTEPNILQEEAVKFFKNLFCTKEALQQSSCNTNITPLCDAGKVALTQPVTKKEVHRALMSMKSYKAPGPDGFQPIFYKMFSEDVGDDIRRFVRASFTCGQFSAPVSDTLMVLIPSIPLRTFVLLVCVMFCTRLSLRSWFKDFDIYWETLSALFRAVSYQEGEPRITPSCFKKLFFRCKSPKRKKEI